MNGQAIFTAAEIARCRRCKPQVIRKLLKNIEPDGSRIVNGISTKAWLFASLPSPVVARLVKRAQQFGFQTPVQLLQNPPAPSDLFLLGKVADREIEEAQKLSRALRPCLNAASADASIAELARATLPAYRREFGYVVSDRHLRYLIARVIERDGGERNFERVQLYLRAKSRKPVARSSPLTASFRFNELDAALGTIRDRTRPTLSEISYCWREVIALFGDRIASGVNEIKLKQELRDYFVDSAPFLGPTPAAAKRNLNRKLRQAIDGGGINQLRDGRLQPAKRRRKSGSHLAADLKLLAQHTVFFTGQRLAQAYRELLEGTTHTGERFSEEFRATYPFNVREAKSEVPKFVRQSVRPIVRAMWKHRLGPRAARLAAPSIHRDWREVAAGNSYTSDDVTLNHYVIDWHECGEYEFDGQRFNVVRPQFLPVVDERTGNPLGFSLIPAPTYTSWQIRTLIARICMRPEIGLPFEHFLFELAIWQSRNVEALGSWSAIDESFSRCGVNLQVRHATTPKAKVIEQVIGALQNLDEFAPGYVGRGEQRVKHERVQRFLLQLKRFGQPRKPDVDPREMLMTMAECEEMLVGVMERFANEPQNGERLDGLSPAEGWMQLSGDRPHVVLPESLRFLLGTAESIQTVTSEGVMLRIGRSKHYYCGSEKLGALLGDKVRVRFNPELPEQIVVSHLASDPNGLQPFAVPLFEKLPAHGATAEDFARAHEHQNRFTSYGRALFRELAPKANKTWSSISRLGSPHLHESGDAHNRIERELIERRDGIVQDRRAIRQLADEQRLGIDSSRVRNTKRTRAALQKLPGLQAKILAAEQAATTERSPEV